MRIGLNGAAALALLALAGCQSGGSTPPPAPGTSPPPAANEPAAPAGDKVAVCTQQAGRKYGVSGDDLSLSNDYPTETGDAVDGSAQMAQGGFKRFRCDFSRDGAFVSITELPADAA